MFCSNCGNQVSDTARFCGSCGTALKPMPMGAAPVPPAAGPVPGATPYSGGSPTAGAGLPPPPAGPAFAPPPVAPAGAFLPDFPAPPDLHWLVVLIISAFTYGLGAFVWAFKQAFFVRKLDPESKGVRYLTLSSVAMLVQVAVYFAMMRSAFSGELLLAAVMVLNVVIMVFAYIGLFGMRQSLLRHYNAVEPIGLRLGGVMTFFFSILYFQYHFSRIAKRKKAGGAAGS